jgi:hypothetical protein
MSIDSCCYLDCRCMLVSALILSVSLHTQESEAARTYTRAQADASALEFSVAMKSPQVQPL